ncbi:pentatricopeptide repeat-containing protein At3g57430, chloroplastic-like [Cryptomeria japonica]|uniref:pentatricopeptide repeat-containing protein At3g57430, chloroplastic-like n=1 Tax=Cryptomeria japonica TaxID=3369 RepID=UPI0027DA5F2C|nr:pentatricopeptide repeat-containing protein At3g57430, chloroplastic-like [Cryptomeria japonica]
MTKEKKVKKTPGCSWIEVNRNVHTFLIGDRLHPQTEKIYETLEMLSMQMKALEYVPDLSFVLSDVEEEQKELILSHHSEKQAIAFGFMNTHPGTIIRVTKTLRICRDFHIAGIFLFSLDDNSASRAADMIVIAFTN